ncbi:MAG: hypothetical protein AB4352_04760 [Hormoscilla sp.]
MSNLVERLNATAHPRLERTLGYQANSRWVAWHWEPQLNQVMHNDGENIGTGNGVAWQIFLQHPQVSPSVQDYNLGAADQYWMLLDRYSRNLYVGLGPDVQSLLEAPESLALLASLDGSNNFFSETADALKDSWERLTNSEGVRNLRNSIPLGVGVALLAAVGIGGWYWLKPIMERQPAATETPLVACGTGGSGDFSAYFAPAMGSQELHVISVYEARSDHRAGYHPTGLVEVKVQRQEKPIILALSAYEPVHWNVTLEPGVKVEYIILNGYHQQSISGVDGVPVDKYIHRGIRSRSGHFSYKWLNSLEYKPLLVQRLEQYTRTKLTSFQGCYRGTSFQLK